MDLPMDKTFWRQRQIISDGETNFERSPFAAIPLKCEPYQEFPGGPVVRTWPFHCRVPGSIPGRETS